MIVASVVAASVVAASVVVASVVKDHVALIVGGYVLVLGSFALYAARLLARGRKLAKQLSDQDKPWT